MSSEPNLVSGGTEHHLETYTNPLEQVNTHKQDDGVYLKQIRILEDYIYIYIYKILLHFILFVIVEGGNFRNILDKAVQADQVVKERYNTHCEMIALLCKSESELCASIPSANPAKTLQGSEVKGNIKQPTVSLYNQHYLGLVDIHTQECILYYIGGKRIKGSVGPA